MHLIKPFQRLFSQKILQIVMISLVSHVSLIIRGHQLRLTRQNSLPTQMQVDTSPTSANTNILFSPFFLSIAVRRNMMMGQKVSSLAEILPQALLLQPWNHLETKRQEAVPERGCL